MERESENTAASQDAEVRNETSSAKATQADALYQLLFELMPGSILLMDGRGVVMDANPAFCSQIGYTRKELIGQHVSFFSKDSLETIERNIERLMAGETLEHDVVNIQKDGSPRHYELREKAIRLPDGTKCILALSNDITQRVVAEREKLKLQSQVLHAEKLKSLGLMAGGIAHDFNNLLAAIIGNIELGILEAKGNPVVREMLNDGLTAAKRAAHLTQQMLAYSGRGHFHPADLDLNNVIRGVTELLHATVSKKASLQLNLASSLPAVNGDSAQIQQIVVNLVTNASEALEDKPGLITVTTSVRDCDAAYLTANRAENSLKPGQFVVLEISDSGCGMNEVVQQQLFDPFFTTKFTGRGLGLSAVLGTVRAHEGGIFVSSRVGKGTRVCVLFPAGAAQLLVQSGGEIQAKQHGQISIPVLSGTVLVADDEDIMRSMVERLLKRTGLRVLLAEDGPGAVEQFKRHASEITFVLLDLTMPNLDGLKALAEIRRHKPDVKAILTSGFDEAGLHQRSIEEGFVGFIPKPYDAETLLGLAKRICAGEL